ncbi:MAG: radical SAM protein [Desulfurococcaceae archaeon]|nr:radical SAM protein [Desulfurococcaceae archaeon]
MFLVRASIGTLAVLGLIDLKILETPTTAYFLQYSPSGCSANCAYCLQSRRFAHSSSDKLGRVIWPLIDLETIKKAWRKSFTRICFQTVIKRNFASEALKIIENIRSFEPNIPISLAITPVPRVLLESVVKWGVDVIGVGLDTATLQLFNEWNKPYSWDLYWRFIEKAVEVYGRGNIYVHLIVGLGESFKELVDVMRKIYRLGGRIALFNYINERGVSPVNIKYYRLVQLARFLLENGLNPDLYIDYEHYIVKGEIPLDNILEAFYTSGCPGCNRPFYSESPRGPLYNIPSRRLLGIYYEKLREELLSIGVSL